MCGKEMRLLFCMGEFAIMSDSKDFRERINCRVEDGRKVRFWEDRWFGAPLYRKFLEIF